VNDPKNTPESGTPRPMRRWVLLGVGVVTLGMVGLVASVVAFGVFMSWPWRARVVGPPSADLHAEAVEIASLSGATLRGWFVAGRPGAGAVVLMHGSHSNRLNMVRRVRLLSAEGLSVLLFDFQAHGESTGKRITFGLLEARDAESAVAYMRGRLPDERVGAIGSSLGGAAALLGPDPLPVDALVLEAVFPDIDAAVANRMRAVLGRMIGNVVAPPLTQLFMLVLPPVLGLWPDDLRPIDRIARVTAPLLIIGGTRDSYTPLAETWAMFERAPEPKLFWAVEGAGHVDLETYAPEQYRKMVLPFLIERLQKPR
jgi:uncharacterized protein